MLQEANGAIAQQHPGAGQGNSAIGTLEQRNSEFIFKLADMAGQRRLCDVQQCRRARHTSELGNLKKKAKLFNVHDQEGVSLSCHQPIAHGPESCSHNLFLAPAADASTSNSFGVSLEKVYFL
jgi:hypothetical protein